MVLLEDKATFEGFLLFLFYQLMDLPYTAFCSARFAVKLAETLAMLLEGQFPGESKQTVLKVT